MEKKKAIRVSEEQFSICGSELYLDHRMKRANPFDLSEGKEKCFSRQSNLILFAVFSPMLYIRDAFL